MAVTKRQTLLECLEVMEKVRNAFSKDGKGLLADERYGTLFYEYDEKSRILRELIQSLEYEPVRTAMANWQRVVLDRGPEDAMLLEKELDNIRHFDIEDYIGNNGLLGGQHDEPDDQK